MGTTATVSPIKAEEVKGKVRGFDLEKFEKVSREVTTSYTPLPEDSTLEAILQAVGGNLKALVLKVNASAKRDAIKAVKDHAFDDSPTIVRNVKPLNSFVNAWRLIPPYSEIKEKKEQKKAILAYIRSQEVLLQGIKAACMAPAEDEDEDEEEGEES